MPKSPCLQCSQPIPDGSATVRRAVPSTGAYRCHKCAQPIPQTCIDCRGVNDRTHSAVCVACRVLRKRIRDRRRQRAHRKRKAQAAG